MTNPAPKSGGMPKWLLILIVIFLVMALGCCGVFSACFFFARKAAQTAGAAGSVVIQQAQERALEAEQRAVQAAQQQAAQQAQQSIQPGGSPAAPQADNTPAVETPAARPGNTAAAEALPAGFPTDVPIYSGFKQTYKLAMGDMGSVSFEGTDTPEKVGAFYTTQMDKNNWKQVISSADTNGIIQTYSKDKNSVTLQISGGAKTTLQITYAKQQ